MRSNQAMAQSLDTQHRNRALLYTGVAAALLTLLILFLKWRIEIPVKPEEPTTIEVELNLPPEPPIETEADGGGGGGNIAQAIGPTGAAPESPQPSGEPEPAKEIADPEEKEAVVVKPVITKKESPKITKPAVVKTTPKKEENPAPPQPKMVMGKKNNRTGTGADSPDDFNRSGNQGTGLGVGKGSGSGGGSGTGMGGGNGSGTGTGNGPAVTSGNRKIVRASRFDGDMDNATIFARIRVSPEGKGSFVEFAKGSTHRTNQYKQAITQYLSKIQFDRSEQEDIVTVQFNFLVN
jgi:outer membrane biosynthesis protein TonB